MGTREKQDGIEKTLEAKENEIIQYERNMEEVIGKLQTIETSISRISDDAILQSKLENNHHERERERADEERNAAVLRGELDYLLSLVNEGEAANAMDAAALEDLKAIGEDVSDASRIVAERETWAWETKQKIDALMERLGGKTSERMQRMAAKRRLSDNINHSYRDTLESRYNNATSNVKEVFDNFVNDVIIQSKDLPLNEVPHYSPSNNISHPRGVYFNALNDNSNPRGAGTTYYHEVGHMIDHLATNLTGNISFNDRFGSALLSDGEDIVDLFNNLSNAGCRNFLSLINKDSSHSLSDLLEATTSSRIRGAYGHGADYWKTSGNMQAEAFAHFFEASMGADDKRNLLEMFFPTSIGIFNEMIDSLRQPIYTKSYTRGGIK